MTEMEGKIYRIIEREGPVLPVNISRKMAQGTMLISAILTSMVKRDRINKTQQKIGSSSLYYLDSQESEALNRIKENIDPLKKKVYNFLKDKKIVKDKDAGAKRRAVLRELRDFADDFEYRDKKYWKFHTLSENQAISIIRERTAEKLEEEGEEEKEERSEEEERKEKKVKHEEREETGEEEGKEEKVEAEPSKEAGEGQKEKEEKKEESEELSFEEKITNFLKNKGAEIVEKDVIRKRYEINLVIKAQSLFGKRKFFIKARSKKRINEQELSLAYLEGNERKMPTIFLTDGNLTNKAKEYANEELGSVFKIVKID